MKIQSLLVLLWFAGVTGSVASATEPGFTVMCWNLEWFFDESKQGNYSELAQEKSAPTRGLWNWRRDAVAASIAKVSPAIVAVQEIEGPQVLWYLSRALEGEHDLKYDEHAIQGNDHYTEQDVGLLTTAPTEALSLMRGAVTQRMRREGIYASVPKHVAALVEVSVAGETESILVVNTHLLVGKQFDRILVSRSLVEDESGRPDLCLRSVAVRPDLSIRGDADEPDEHWNHYWEIETAHRDLSDHYPLVAEFEIR